MGGAGCCRGVGEVAAAADLAFEIIVVRCDAEDAVGAGGGFGERVGIIEISDVQLHAFRFQRLGGWGGRVANQGAQRPAGGQQLGGGGAALASGHAGHKDGFVGGVHEGPFPMVVGMKW